MKGKSRRKYISYTHLTDVYYPHPTPFPWIVFAAAGWGDAMLSSDNSDFQSTKHHFLQNHEYFRYFLHRVVI